MVFGKNDGCLAVAKNHVNAICTRCEVFAFYFDRMRKRNGRIFIGTCPPRCGFAGAESQVNQPVMRNGSTPNFPFASFHTRSVIGKTNLSHANLLRQTCLFIAASGSGGELSLGKSL